MKPQRLCSAVILFCTTTSTITSTTSYYQFSTKTTAAANLPKPFSKIPSRYKERVIQESQTALAEYLHCTRSLSFIYADHIARNCPHSLWDIVAKIPFSPSTSVVQSLHRFLRYHPINELEFFLESVGFSRDKNGIMPPSLLPRDTYFLSDWKHFNVICALAGMGFPWSKLGLFCKKDCLLVETDPLELERKFSEIKDGYGFSSVCVIGICLAFPQVLYDKKMDGLLSDMKILFLDNDLLSSVDDTIDAIFYVCEKIRLFYDLGCEMGEVGEFLGRGKIIFLDYSKEVVVSKIDYFCKLNVQKDQIGKFLLSRPEVFGFDLKDRVVCVSGFLVQLGLSINELKSLEQKFPHVFGRNRIVNLPNAVKSLNLDEWFFERVCNGGYSLLGSYTIRFPDDDLDKHYADSRRKLQAKREYVHAIKKLNFLHGIGFGENKFAVKAFNLLCGNSRELQQRFDCLVRLGIEHSNLCRLMVRANVLNQQETILERKVKFLCTEMQLPLQYLDVFPEFLSYNLEKRIKPRYKFHKWLIDQGFCKKEYSIATFVAYSEKDFVACISRIHPFAAEMWQQNFLKGYVTERVQLAGSVTMSDEASNIPSENSVAESAEEAGLGVSKKRGEYKKRSPAWQHFDVHFEEGKRFGKCKYCTKLVGADSRLNGTSLLLAHSKSCDFNPERKRDGQTTLCLGSDGNNRNGLLNWKFDYEAIRKSIAYMIIVDELPFKHVEKKGFQRVMRTACPFKIPSRWVISKDCYQLYIDEKIKLKALLGQNTSRICLTTDTWTSLQRINYMCLTAHFIDNDWKLNKKILNFCPITSHKGNDIGRSIEKCLLQWGVDNVMTVTVDNASSNDVAIQHLRGKIQNWGKSILGGKWLHVRCVAHIINLIVSDGMKKFGRSIDGIRASVRYVRQSPARLRTFKECVDMEKINCKKALCLDVPTRWNSTYLMLDTACKFERAFENFEGQDSSMAIEIDDLPLKADWQRAKFLVIVLEQFYDLTVKVSGSNYVTSNNLIGELSHINGILKEMMESDEPELSGMARTMQEKYDKYWGNVEKMNMLVFIAYMLDPTTKFEFFQFIACKMYGDDKGVCVAARAKDAMYELFDEYARANGLSNTQSSGRGGSESDASSLLDGFKPKTIKEKYKMEFKKRKVELGGKDSKSELDKYLNEECEDDDSDMDILNWWKCNSIRFPILAQMARDVLAIPMSTVASESAFSTGGRVLDQFRSSLTPRIVQALICSQDWLRSSDSCDDIEEKLEDLEEFESGLLKGGTESSIVDL